MREMEGAIGDLKSAFGAPTDWMESARIDCDRETAPSAKDGKTCSFTPYPSPADIARVEIDHSQHSPNRMFTLSFMSDCDENSTREETEDATDVGDSSVAPDYDLHDGATDFGGSSAKLSRPDQFASGPSMITVPLSAFKSAYSRNLTT